MFQRIVVACDGSEESRSSTLLAFALAAPTGAAVALVDVVDTHGAEVRHPEALALLEDLRQEAEQGAEQQLAALAAAAPEGAVVTTQVLHGPAAATLIHYIHESGADLAVVGTHGVGGLARRLTGSVSRHVLDHAHCSVLLVHAEMSWEGPLTIVAALDGSDASLTGLAAAQAIAAALGATLCLAHVADPHIHPSIAPPSRQVVDLVTRHGEQVIEEARAALPGPVENVIEDLRLGAPAAGLLAACEQHMPAIAVVGSRGVGGFRGLLIGSTARALVDHAPCPVLVTRPLPAAGHQ